MAAIVTLLPQNSSTDKLQKSSLEYGGSCDYNFKLSIVKNWVFKLVQMLKLEPRTYITVKTVTIV